MPLIPEPKSRPPVLRDSKLDQLVGPNIVNRQLRDVFRQAFDRLGGADWLVDFASQSEGNARVFVSAISKLLPATVADAATERKIVDIPWLKRERLSYSDAERAGDVTDIYEAKDA